MDPPPRGQAPLADRLSVLEPWAVSIWRRLGSSKSDCEDYDYFPTGGMLNFACHLRSLTSLSELVEHAGRQPFVSGILRAPKSKGEFAHYDSTFVAWAATHLIPGASDARTREALQPVYDRYVRFLARTFAVTRHRLDEESSCAAREKDAYQALIAKQRVPRDYYERWFYFMNPRFCEARSPKQAVMMDEGMDGGWDGNVVKSCVGFWLRRELDGTAAQFKAGLWRLLETHDPNFAKALDTRGPRFVDDGQPRAH